MNAVLTAGSIGIFSPRLDEAVSSTALELRADLSEAMVPAGTSDAERCDAFVEHFIDVVNAAAADGLYASPEAMENAMALVWALPQDMPLPEVIVEQDGEIGLDWDEGRRRAVSVSVGDGPTLSYAALVGAEPLHGRVPFTGTVPETLSFVLRRIYRPKPTRYSIAR